MVQAVPAACGNAMIAPCLSVQIFSLESRQRLQPSPNFPDRLENKLAPRTSKSLTEGPATAQDPW
jgi:hypothetical protein